MARIWVERMDRWVDERGCGKEEVIRGLKSQIWDSLWRERSEKRIV